MYNMVMVIKKRAEIFRQWRQPGRMLNVERAYRTLDPIVLLWIFHITIKHFVFLLLFPYKAFGIQILTLF